MKRSYLLVLLLLVSSFSSLIPFNADAQNLVKDDPPSGFTPSIELEYLGSVLEVDYADSTFTSITLENSVMKWDKVDLSVQYYKLPESSLYEVGYEFEIILKENPKSNVFSFNLYHGGLLFYPQPPLDEESWPKGYTVNTTHAIDSQGRGDAYRPPEIVDSIAVYNGSRKVYHILRPLAYDALFNTVWCTLDIENDVLTVTVPQVFLDSAVYPVTVDPSFGKTSVGGTNWDSTFSSGSRYTLSENGDVTNVTSYWATGGADGTVAIYDVDGSNDPNNLLWNSAELTIGAGWNNFAVSPAESLTAGEYYLMFRTDVNSDAKYDASGEAHYRNWQGAWEDPYVSDGTVAREFSIYANYTIGGNNAPTADSVTITNMVDSDNVYSQHKDYNFNFTVTDADGVAELDFITFALEIGPGWVNGTIDCQSNALNMDVQGNTTMGAVTNTTLGNSANYILPVKTDWDINEASNNDIHFTVNDTVGAGPAMAEKQTDYFDTVNDLVTNAIECTDANNPDRVDISSSIQIDFTVRYENNPSSGTASTSYPPNAEFTSISVYNEWNGVLGTDGTIVNGAGSVTGTSNASVQSTDYNLFINGADADYPDGEEAATEAMITDRVNVTLSVPDTRVNVSGSANIGESAVYAYDGGAHAGTITLNDTEIQAAVGNYTFTVASVTDVNYALTAFLSNDVWCVFDQQQLQTLGANNTTPAANENVTIWATSQSPFDAHVLGAGDTLVLEDTDANTYPMTYNGSHWTWVGSWPANGTITINTYNSVNETTYIITTLDMNSLSLVITVGTTPPPSGNTVDIRVLANSTGDPLENVYVRLYNASGNIFGVYTNSTGYIAQQSIEAGNYTLELTREGYITYVHDYGINTNIYWVIRLFTIEDGAVIQNTFNIELLLFAGLGVIATLGAFITTAVIGTLAGTVGFFLWYFTAQWFMIGEAGASTTVFGYVFYMLAFLSMLMALKNSLEVYYEISRKGGY